MQTITTNKKPQVLVTGATGAQGGSVARTLMREGKFRVRILTRNPQSYRALVLQRAGAEIVVGDMQDKESLKKAMAGVYGVFGVTNFWEHYGNEYELGKNLADAAEECAVSHLVMHTLPDYHQLSNGKYSVPHYDLKAKLETYIRSRPVPASFVHMGFYYENFLSFFPLQKDNSGNYYFGFPQGQTKLAAVSVEDTGPVVSYLFGHPAEMMGKTVMITGADLTCDEYAAIMEKVLGKRIYYTHIPANVYKAYDFPGAAELAAMFEVQRLYIPGRQKELEESLRMNPAMQSFEAWVAKNKAKFISYFNSQLEAMVI
ncbi:MAG: NmrA/HSCARG family protein [Chitinophagaceae bacterium]